MLIEEFADDINNYIQVRFGYKRRCTIISILGHTVMVNQKRVDLYLRLLPRGEWPSNSLVVARIGFSRERVGHGTHFLVFLVQLSEKYGYTEIGIENTHEGENIQNFVRKHGFQHFKGNNHWIVSVKTLSERLTAPVT
jgi:hypothetical protein